MSEPDLRAQIKEMLVKKLMLQGTPELIGDDLPETLDLGGDRRPEIVLHAIADADLRALGDFRRKGDGCMDGERRGQRDGGCAYGQPMDGQHGDLLPGDEPTGDRRRFPQRCVRPQRAS